VASGGERKLLGLALAAALGRTLEESERTPVYLLDDLDAELDDERLRAVWALFRSRSQVLVSSNRQGSWRALETDSRWALERGVLGPSTKAERGTEKLL
jgi:recombinational DNA repair ATPase RecF